MQAKDSRYKYTCAHCRTGLVPDLPCRCPECGRMLTVPIPRKTEKESNNKK